MQHIVNVAFDFDDKRVAKSIEDQVFIPYLLFGLAGLLAAIKFVAFFQLKSRQRIL